MELEPLYVVLTGKYPTVSFETDEDCLSFLVRILYHKGEEGESSTFMISEANDKESENFDKELRQRNLSKIQIGLLKLINTFPNTTLINWYSG